MFGYRADSFTTRPSEKFVTTHEIQDSSIVNLRFERGRKAEFYKPELGRTMSVGAY